MWMRGGNIGKRIIGLVDACASIIGIGLVIAVMAIVYFMDWLSLDGPSHDKFSNLH
jgi:hypothetical protein